jgi:hypothetical protein
MSVTFQTLLFGLARRRLVLLRTPFDCRFIFPPDVRNKTALPNGFSRTRNSISCPSLVGSHRIRFAEGAAFKISCVARPRNNPQPDSWKKKLPPVFFEISNLNQQFEKRWSELQKQAKRELEAAGPKKPELQKEISDRFFGEVGRLNRWFEEHLVDIDRRHAPVAYNPIAYNYLTLDPPTSDSEGIREYLHFQRHGEALRITQTKDSEGDLEAWDKISRSERDIRILAFGEGPIAPFQGDVVHRQLLEIVIFYERERLIAEELAQCFDKYCACGKENHDADALRKMRDRFETELQAGRADKSVG